MATVETIISVIGGFISAVIAGILLRLWLNHHYRPILVIDGNDAIIVRSFLLHNRSGTHTLFNSNRVSVRNIGKSAAKDCRAYIGSWESVERTAWMIPDKNSGYTLILNVQDREYVDLCAISPDDLTRVLPSEHGYSLEFAEEYGLWQPDTEKWYYWLTILSI